MSPTPVQSPAPHGPLKQPGADLNTARVNQIISDTTGPKQHHILRPLLPAQLARGRRRQRIIRRSLRSLKHHLGDIPFPTSKRRKTEFKMS